MPSANKEKIKEKAIKLPQLFKLLIGIRYLVNMTVIFKTVLIADNNAVQYLFYEVVFEDEPW